MTAQNRRVMKLASGRRPGNEAMDGSLHNFRAHVFVHERPRPGIPATRREGCAVPQPATRELVGPQNGRWGAKIELKKVEDGKFIAEVDGRGVTYTSEWNALEGPGTLPGPGRWFTYSPHLRTLSFPLWEGKSWGGKVMWTSIGGFTGVGEVNIVAKTRGWETVKVPAGEFEAIKVEIVSQGGRTDIKTICWYAPEAQNFVKCDSTNRTSTFELASYKLFQ